MIVANTSITVLRGEGTDGWGDAVDADRPVATRIPAAKMEINRQTERKDTDTPRNIRSYRFRVSRRVDIRDGDRIRDERDGLIYIVDKVKKPTAVVAQAPTNIECRLVLDTTNTEP